MTEELSFGKLKWQPALFSTPLHERVHDLLRRLISQGAADFFADACELIQRDPPLRSTTHVVGHLSREVESAVRQVLITMPEAAEHFEVSGSPKQSSETHIRQINATLSALGVAEDPRSATWRGLTGHSSLAGSAHRDNLQRPRVPDPEFREFFDELVHLFWVVLDAAERRYDSVITRVQEICEKPQPTEADVEELAVHLAPGTTALERAFERLRSKLTPPTTPWTS